MGGSPPGEKERIPENIGPWDPCEFTQLPADVMPQGLPHGKESPSNHTMPVPTGVTLPDYQNSEGNGELWFMGKNAAARQLRHAH